MSKPKWTQGPWSVQTEARFGRVYIYSDTGVCICKVAPNAYEDRDSTRGVADLLSMAPDFAAEAATLVDWWDDDDAEKPELPYEVGHALIRLRHILRMARGET